MVSAWATENRLVIAQDAVDDKKNEIVSIPKVLKMIGNCSGIAFLGDLS